MTRKNSLKRRSQTHCSQCQRKLGLGLSYKGGRYFCGSRCANAYTEHRRIGVELVRLARKTARWAC
jgi:hypothetical protein